MTARIGTVMAAVVAAAAMVVAAVVVRGRIDEHQTTARLTCSTELATVCGKLPGWVKVTVEPAGTTADRLAALGEGADPGLDGWLVGGPWPEMVDADRQRRAASALFSGRTTPLASTSVVAVVAHQRTAAVKSKCGDPPSWTCLAGLVGGSWKDASPSENGRVSAGLPDPTSESEGLAALGAVSTAVFKGRDFRADDDALLGALRKLRAATTKQAADAVTLLLVSRGAELDVALTTEATAGTVLKIAADPTLATVLYPAPVATLQVEVGTIGAGASARKLDDYLQGDGRKVLVAAGWQGVTSGATPADAGTLAALRQVWKDVR